VVKKLYRAFAQEQVAALAAAGGSESGEFRLTAAHGVDLDRRVDLELGGLTPPTPTRR
jgi:hypothetical protein